MDALTVVIWMLKAAGAVYMIWGLYYTVLFIQNGSPQISRKDKVLSSFLIFLSAPMLVAMLWLDEKLKVGKQRFDHLFILVDTVLYLIFFPGMLLLLGGDFVSKRLFKNWWLLPALYVLIVLYSFVNLYVRRWHKAKSRNTA